MMTRLAAIRIWNAIASRVIAGTLGAFALGALATTVLSLVLARLGITPSDAVTIALMTGPVILALLSLSVFHARNALRAWVWLIAGAIPLTIGLALLWERTP